MRFFALASVLLLSFCVAHGASAADWKYDTAGHYGSSCAGGHCAGGYFDWGFGCCEHPAPYHDYLWADYCHDRARIWSWRQSRHYRNCGPGF